MLHLWAKDGPLDTFYAKDGGPLSIWRQWAPRAYGQAMKGGHFFPEENPDDTAIALNQFLSAQTVHRRETGRVPRHGVSRHELGRMMILEHPAGSKR